MNFLRRATHSRPKLATTEQAMTWLQAWDSEHLLYRGVIPFHPWRNTTERELRSTAEALLKLRALVDAGVRRG